jgi:hypothetical protein
MTASQAAREKIRAGVAPALAIHTAAREWGTSTKAVALGLRAKVIAPAKRPVAQWWD